VEGTDVGAAMAGGVSAAAAAIAAGYIASNGPQPSQGREPATIHHAVSGPMPPLSAETALVEGHLLHPGAPDLLAPLAGRGGGGVGPGGGPFEERGGSSRDADPTGKAAAHSAAMQASSVAAAALAGAAVTSVLPVLPPPPAPSWANQQANLMGSAQGKGAGTGAGAGGAAPPLQNAPPPPPALTAALDESTLRVGMTVSAFVDNPAVSEPVAVGRITSKIASNVFAVTFDVSTHSSAIIEIGSRVVVVSTDGKSSTGLVARVHGNGSFGVLFDDDKFDNSVTRDRISISEGSPTFVHSDHYAAVLQWVYDAGVTKKSDAQSASSILYRRGWRRENMYLLEPFDVHCLSHLNKAVRLGILEAADDEKDKYRFRRDFKKEALKEKANWKYFLTKYSGAFGTLIAFCGACSVFTWNYKNYRRQQRPMQVQLAVETLERSAHEPAAPGTIQRRETKRLQRFLEMMDARHPRITLLTGNLGSGKTSAIREAARGVGAPIVFVELRGKDKEDPVRAIAKALGVTSVDLCGELFGFVADACTAAKQRVGKLPVIVLKLRGTDLGLVYSDAIVIAHDRRVANIFIEVDAESLHSTAAFERTDCFHVSDFTEDEATQYLARRVDPVELPDFFETVGTNTVDLDELISNVQKRATDVGEWVSTKLDSAVLRVRQQPLPVQTLLAEMARMPFDQGMRRGNDPTIDKAVQQRMLFYHFERGVWMFRSRLLYEGARVVSGYA
jgi:hypothetical protein